MRKNVLKTTLLSMAAASLLTSTAMAEVTASFNNITGDKFTQEAERIDLLSVQLSANTVSKLNNITLLVSDKESDGTELNTSLISDISIYQRGLDITDRIGQVTFSDVNTTGITVSVDFTERFFKTSDDDYPNTFHISANYNSLASDLITNNSSLTAEVKSINVKENYYSDTVTKTINNSAVDVDVNIGSSVNKTVTKTIDKQSPTIGVSVKDATISGVVYEVGNADNNNTNYKFANSTLIYQFDEDLNSALITNDAVTAGFKITDSLGKVISIDGSSYKDGITGVTNDANLTLVLNSAELNASTGHINIVYSGEFLKDDFGNLVGLDNTNDANDFNLSTQLFTDNSTPEIATLVLDFDDKSKGRLIFSEVVRPSLLAFDNLAAWNKGVVFVDSTSLDLGISKITKVENVADSKHHNSLRTVLSFDLNGTVSSTDFSLRFNTIANVEGNISDITSHQIVNNPVEQYSVTKIGKDLVSNGAWALISLDSNTRTTSVRALESGAIQTIWGYENEQWNKFPENLKAGQGYWIKGSAIATTTFTNVEVAKEDSDTIAIDGTKVIASAKHNTWQLLGTPTALTWSQAYSQVAEGCYGVSVFAYDGTNWNADTTGIPANSGIWVKQDCSEEE